jgi:membrane-bound metal-dependent hydrolase YbcI (DUF457 family)
MCWGYVTGRATGSLLGVSANPFLLLFLAALPDIDLLLGIFGIQHRTWTHSLLIWSLVFAPLFILYKKRSIPYFIAPIQHIIFGDAMVGSWNRPLWPVSQFNFTLGYNLFSVELFALEAIGLAIFMLLVLATKSGRNRFFTQPSKRVLAVLPLVMLVGFVVFVMSYAWASDTLVDWKILREDVLIDDLPTTAQNPIFALDLAMHLILIGLLSASLVMGFKRKPDTTTSKTQDPRYG